MCGVFIVRGRPGVGAKLFAQLFPIELVPGHMSKYWPPIGYQTTLVILDKSKCAQNSTRKVDKK
jgi:hypothetical protein